MNLGAIPAPTSLADVEELVKRLYLPGTPRSTISEIDRHLKSLQLSHDGWNLADSLLGSQDQNCRFFGALTFQIKLNVHGFNLNEEEGQSVLLKLIHWTVQTFHNEDDKLVRRKLCAALGTYFVRTPFHWTRPLSQVAASFGHGTAVSLDTLGANSAVNQFLPALGESQLVALLWLSSAIATEVAKVAATTPFEAQLHASMESIGADNNTIMKQLLERRPLSYQAKETLLYTYLTWVEYSCGKTNNKASLVHLRKLFGGLATLLTDEESYSLALSTFSDILEHYTNFLQAEQLDVLAVIISDSLGPILLQGLRDSEEEADKLAQIVIEYGNATVETVVVQPQDQARSRNIVHLCQAILQCPGYPGDDEGLAAQSIGFWNTYVEYVTDALSEYSSNAPGPEWGPVAKAVCFDLAKTLHSKMLVPPTETTKDWHEEEFDGFKEFRTDAADLILSLFYLLRASLVQFLISLVQESLHAMKWQELEASLYCLNAFADNVLDDDEIQEHFSQLFGSALYRHMADESIQIPLQTRKTAIETLGLYGQYIEQHVEYLPDSLRFLFACLEHPGMRASAAKSIASLCSACRRSLTGELSGFLDRYHQLTTSPSSDAYINDKVIGAIAAIVQAVDPESTKAQYLSTLLDFIDHRVQQAKELVNSANFDEAHTAGLSALTSLANIGTNLQVPEDVPISLDDDEGNARKPSYWQGPEGQSIQTRILNVCLAVWQLFPASGEVVDEACKVLKSGSTETEDGPFVFSPSILVSFVEQCTVQTPNFESVLSMACLIITQHSRTNSRRIDAEVHRVYMKVCEISQALGTPSQDPTLAHMCINVLVRMVPRYLNVLLDASTDGQRLQMMLDFVTQALISTVMLAPKTSAAEFWTLLLGASSQEDQVQLRLKQVVDAYGPVLTEKVVDNITGGMRSEIASLTPILKSLLHTDPRSRTWIESALLARTDLRVTDADKRRFVQSCFAARNENAKLKELVIHFFAACRGTVASFSTAAARPV